MPDQVRFTSRLLVISAICVGILALILISPVLLLELSHVKGVNWQQLSNIGQTYGVSSAILAGIALLGIAFSLVIQARQAKTERMRIVRERHIELLQIILDDPEQYAPVVGMDPESGVDEIRKRLFLVMWLNYARMGYQTDVLTGNAVRADIIQPMFRSDLTRSWWDSNRVLWLNSPVPEHRARRFAEIVDEEYQKAVATGPAAITVLNDESNKVSAEASISSSHWRAPLAIGSGIVIGVLIRSYIGVRSGYSRTGKIPS
jgi:hypothetical protein